MRVGVPKEIKVHEYRVGLTPGAVREYVAAGHDVVVETNAGAGIGATDEAYRKVGAGIAGSAAEIFAASDMIVKVKEPQPREWSLLREGQILFTYLHLAPDPEQAKGLMASGCTAIAYETVTDAKGGLPLLAPMSEVAGRLSIEAAGSALKKSAGGRGLLLGGVPGVIPARVVVLGGGVVGTHAARMAVGLGAEVTILDRSIPRLRELDELFEGRARTRFSTIEAVEHEVFAADVVIGAVLVPGASAPKLVTRAMLKSMQKGAVLVDVAIDQGGCFETSHPTTHAEPDLRGRWHHPLLRSEYAGRGSPHLEPCPEQCDAAVRPGLGQSRLRGRHAKSASARRPERSSRPHRQQGRRRKPRPLLSEYRGTARRLNTNKDFTTESLRP